MPKVSIIVPNYNHEAFLKQRLESVLNQTYQDFELILLDDASSDNSQRLLNAYKSNPKVSNLLINEINSGSVFRQWIKGIEQSQGEFIWIAESDDFASPEFLETTVKVLEHNNSLGMVFTDTLKVDRDSNSLGLVSESKKILKNLTEQGGVINQMNLSSYLLKQMVIVNASSVLFRKEALMGIDFNTLEKFKNAGDIFVYTGIAIRNNILFLPKVLNFMRLHNKNTTKQNKRNGQLYKDKLLILDYYLKDFKVVKISKVDLLSFLKSNILFFADFNSMEHLTRTLKKMVDFGFISKLKQIKISTVIFLYYRLAVRRGPHKMRMVFKYVMNKI